MTADAGFVQTSQGRLYHEMAGDGPPLVLIHGGLWDARMWDDQFEAFAQRRSVLRYDLRGFGRSERPTGPFSNTQDLTELLQHVGIERTAVLGLSMGGRVAIDFTLEHPEMVSALIPVAAGLGGFEYEDPELEKRWHELEAAIEAGDIDRAVDIELEIWAPVPTDPDAERRCRAIAHQNTFELTMDESWPRHIDPPAVGRLGEIRVPTLVIVGDRDQPLMLAIADALVQGIAGARRAVVAGADHVPNMRYPVEFNRLVLDFLVAATER